MYITFLGTGTSHGIPVVGCDCRVCSSEITENKRYRSSVFIETEKHNILVDAATEFRLQAVREKIKHIDLVLITHAHADHVHGLDDLRPLTGKKRLPVFGNIETIRDMEQRFSYIVKSNHVGGGKPEIDFNILDDILELKNDHFIVPIPVKHGNLDIYGYRIDKFAYITDCSFIPESSFALLEGIEVLTLGALRYKPHITHFTIDQAVEAVKRTGCRIAYLTHFCHDIDHVKLKKELPENIRPAFDRMRIEI